MPGESVIGEPPGCGKQRTEMDEDGEAKVGVEREGETAYDWRKLLFLKEMCKECIIPSPAQTDSKSVGALKTGFGRVENNTTYIINNKVV